LAAAAPDATNYQDLIPVTIAREVLGKIIAGSAVMALARVVRMPAGVEKIPVLSVAPTAKFVNPTYGGRKPVSKVVWTTEQVVAEEIATVLSIPNAFLDDAGFPIWENVRPLVTDAIERCFDAAVLYGDGAPATYPAGGLVAWAAPAPAGADGATAIDNAFTQVEGHGLEVDGILGGPALRGIYRNLAITKGWASDVAGTPEQSLFGVRFATTPVWDSGKGYALAGDWSYVVVGVREDIRFDLSTEGVLTDDDGAVTVNAFQDDSTLMRAYMRVGVAFGKPMSADASGQVDPLALAQLGGSTGAAASTSEPPRRAAK
jgi:hypothetical protein